MMMMLLLFYACGFRREFVFVFIVLGSSGLGEHGRDCVGSVHFRLALIFFVDARAARDYLLPLILF